MTVKRVAGVVATLAGCLLLALAVSGVGLVFYYRPTIEYAYVEGHALALPFWLTGEVFGAILAGLLGLIGVLLFWTGRRWRRA